MSVGDIFGTLNDSYKEEEIKNQVEYEQNLKDVEAIQTHNYETNYLAGSVLEAVDNVLFGLPSYLLGDKVMSSNSQFNPVTGAKNDTVGGFIASLPVGFGVGKALSAGERTAKSLFNEVKSTFARRYASGIISDTNEAKEIVIGAFSDGKMFGKPKVGSKFGALGNFTKGIALGITTGGMMVVQRIQQKDINITG